MFATIQRSLGFGPANPDQELELPSPTPEESIAEPPPEEKALPAPVRRVRKKPQTRRASITRTGAQQLRRQNALERLNQLKVQLHSMASNGIAMEWLEQTSNDNVLAEMLPIWTENCDRHLASTLPLEMGDMREVFQEFSTTAGFAREFREKFSSCETSIRGQKRLRLTFQNDDVRMITLAMLLDIAFEKLCDNP